MVQIILNLDHFLFWKHKFLTEETVRSKKFWVLNRLIYMKPNMVFSHFWWWGGLGVKEIKVVQNGVKHVFVLQFLRSNDIFEICI